MEQAYLFVHFKEKSTPDGEQVYFSLSRDGFHWETVNGGNPVLWSYYGDKGVRDFTIIRCKNNKFYIFATDLSLSYGMRNQYHNSWEEIGRNGSKFFAVWESENLVDWSEQRMVKLGTEEMGCLWAPDIIYDESHDDYVLHWSSSHKDDGYRNKGIFFCRTKDFEHFTEPKALYRRGNSSVIDSAIYWEEGTYYMFLRCDTDAAAITLFKSDQIEGPYEKIEAFDSSMKVLENGLYEAPTAVRLADGRWCLFLDYYGVPGAGQGYVPFISRELKSGNFVRSDKEFNFPYGFKHGTILTITLEEYKRIKDKSWLS